ncbi:MAG: Hsp20/alpha crystallin family protein [Winogradskyella sp.]|uniref:Hsp20/alpha crystallin family protein n=1 Tax=Winogradskyella sp. TaxID=1883156 RepID=UPI0018296DB4|nr:Hsp20/alpha crystallin family protein [Winogradskyella sp.]MBT8245867.1 Hsp20/alpha crystallin family protein [Winogradskyella sp.]NNK23062.1 Hsp20/alpha crystallin family protein [Winogradskyella sp.]
MSLIKFNNRNRLFPWNNNQLKDFFSSDDFLLNDSFFEEDSLMPAMNIKELDETFEVEFAAPGFKKSDFEVTLEDHLLSVSATKETEKEEEAEDYMRKEFSYNTFKRSITLPETLDNMADIKAVYKDGILKLNILKKELKKETPKKVIEVL